MFSRTALHKPGGWTREDCSSGQPYTSQGGLGNIVSQDSPPPPQSWVKNLLLGGWKRCEVETVQSQAPNKVDFPWLLLFSLTSAFSVTQDSLSLSLPLPHLSLHACLSVKVSFNRNTSSIGAGTHPTPVYLYLVCQDLISKFTSG